MFSGIGKQSGESVESVQKKKRKATVGMICRKGRDERVRGDGMLQSGRKLSTLPFLLISYSNRSQL